MTPPQYEPTFQTLIIPDSVTYIGASAFSGCSGIGSLQLPRSIGVVGENAFADCTELKRVDIPITLQMSPTAFSGCSNLASTMIKTKGAIHACEVLEEMQSDHDYAADCLDCWVYSTRGAKEIEVTFDEATDVAGGSLVLYNGANEVVGRYSGTELAGEKLNIATDTLKIQLLADGAETAYGFRLDSLAARYDVVYKLNNGKQAENNVSGYWDTDEDIELYAPERIGYTFGGWYTNSGFTGKKLNKIEAGSEGNLTLYAKWIITEYKLDYHLAGGKNSSANPSSFHYDTATFKLAAPVQTGYTFEGWYTDPSYKTPITKITKGTMKDISLYAKWTLNTYKVVFDRNGGSGKMSTLNNKKYGEKFKLSPNQFKRDGYTFAGWNTSAKGTGKSYQDKQAVQSLSDKKDDVVTLYAQWKPVKYKVTYKLNGGKNNKNNPSYFYTTDKITLKDASRTGYKFMGWYSDKACKRKVTAIERGTIQNLTLYAKWKPITYNIKFNANGGRGSMNAMKKLSYDKSYRLTNNSFVRERYIFVGWNTKANGKGVSYSNGASIKNLQSKDGKTVTLYAQWRYVY